MNIRLFFDRIYWAFFKRKAKKKQKSYEDWAAKGYNNSPEVSFIIQSHNKSNSVIHIVEQLRKYPNGEIIVIDDGSGLEHTERLSRFLDKGNEFLVRANDLYENVMYDKTIRFSNGKYIVLMQDDDEVTNMDWLTKGLSYFKQYPDMAILGGFNGQEFIIDEEKKWGYVTEYTDRNIYENEFRFVHSVNRAPMLINKALYSQHLKCLEFSFAPFQCDDSELCFRAWLKGLKVGWYNAGFKSLMAGGMRIWNNEFTGFQERNNRAKLYEMYSKDADRISELVNKANEEIK